MRYGIWTLVLAVAAAGCHGPWRQNLPPAERLMHPGPGVDGPGPGVMMWQPTLSMPAQSVQVQFVGPQGMLISWDVSAPGAFDSEPLIVPGRYNFPEGHIYRLKLTNIPFAGREGVELYPTLEIGPTVPRTQAFLAHNAIPVQFTQEDFDQVLSGNFVTKVIYLPDPEFQELALAGVETLVSTRLDPGVDPIVEADRRGAILAIVRMGNKDMQLPTAPAAVLGQASGVVPAGAVVGPGGAPYPAPAAGAMGSASLPGPYIAGVNGPQWGMPISGTPIGLPGPPHVPLGSPAGLQRHTMVNHTWTHLPPPTNQVRVDVKQRPGISYPAPPNHVRITERATQGGLLYRQGWDARHQRTSDACPDCPTEGAAEE